MVLSLKIYFQKSGSEGLVSEVPVFYMGQTSNIKPVDMLILPVIATNNQPVPNPIEGANN